MELNSNQESKAVDMGEDESGRASFLVFNEWDGKAA